jgi:hypothetical protein
VSDVYTAAVIRQMGKQYRERQGDTYEARAVPLSGIIINQDAVRVGGREYKLINTGGLVLQPGALLDVVNVGRPAAAIYAPASNLRQREAGQRTDPLGAHALMSGAHTDVVPNAAPAIDDVVTWNGAMWVPAPPAATTGGDVHGAYFGFAIPMSVSIEGPTNVTKQDAQVFTVRFASDGACSGSIGAWSFDLSGAGDTGIQDVDDTWAAGVTLTTDITVPDESTATWLTMNIAMRYIQP